MAYLIDIGTALPKEKVDQEAFASFYASLFPDELTQRKIRFVCRKSGIEKRHTVYPDLEGLAALRIQDKMDLYHRFAGELALESIHINPAFNLVQPEITDLITVSCTGLKAPGIEFELIDALNLSKNIRRYNINFMGCYASIIALRLANEICKSPGRVVLIASTELCTLHFQPKATDDYLLSNALFADGAASAIVSSEPINGCQRLEEFHSAIIENSTAQMGWDLSEHGFLMSLSTEVPSLIQSQISLPESMLPIHSSPQWAVHPGGRQILEAVSACFSMEDGALSDSHEVLRNCGNMSSATILFILKEMMHKADSSRPIVGCAFGPGLTFESVKMQHV